MKTNFLIKIIASQNKNERFWKLKINEPKLFIIKELREILPHVFIHKDFWWKNIFRWNNHFRLISTSEFTNGFSDFGNENFVEVFWRKKLTKFCEKIWAEKILNHFFAKNVY